MKRIYGFLTIGIYSYWILFAAFVQKNLNYYTTDRYYNLILGAAIASAVICSIGLVYEVYRNRKTLLKKKNLEIFGDKKFVLLLVTIIVGLVFTPALLLSAGIVFIPFKNSKLDEYLNKNIVPAIFILVVVISGIIIPSSTLSSNVASQRSDNLNAVTVNSGRDITQNFNTGSKNYNLGDWIASMNFNPDPNFYKGKDVEVTGFIFTTKNMDASSQFYVGRFVIRCCAADATPVGLKVNFSWKDKFKEGDWIKVTGKFAVSSKDGYDDLYIDPSNVEITSIPDKPYIT
ncbi:MAG: TIGR03943 family putative permease subunit [Candidatus Dojkabacteria bacterium]